MKHDALAFPLAILLLPAAMAQGVPPGLSRGFAPSTVFDVTRPPLSGCAFNIQQVAFQRLPCNPPGELTVTLSVGRLCATYGGDGTALGVVEGSCNLATGTLVLNTHANAIQTPGNQHFNLQLEPGRGRYCVFDSFDGAFTFLGVRFASRAACGMPFGASVPVANIPGTSPGYRDPALGYVGGQLKLFFVATIGGTAGIYMDGLDVSNPNAPRALGSPVLVRGSSRGGTANSPTPITGPDGDVEGLWHADLVAGNVNDMLFAPTLDPTLPSLPTYVNTLWKSNGGVAGGRFLCGDSTFSWQQIAEARGAWLLGDEEPPGGTADIFGGVWSAPGNAAVTVVLLSTGIVSPVTLPGVHGGLCLDVTSMLVLGGMAHDALQMASLSVSVPNDPRLRGLRLAVQGLSVELASNTMTFTNNAWVKVR